MFDIQIGDVFINRDETFFLTVLTQPYLRFDSLSGPLFVKCKTSWDNDELPVHLCSLHEHYIKLNDEEKLRFQLSQ